MEGWAWYVKAIYVLWGIAATVYLVISSLRKVRELGHLAYYERALKEREAEIRERDRRLLLMDKRLYEITREWQESIRRHDGLNTREGGEG